MIPPRGFRAELYPLHHRFGARYLLDVVSETQNSTMIPLVQNYAGVVNPNTIEVNPHNSLFKIETGPICSPMAIIDKLKMVLTFNLTELSLVTEKITGLNMLWRPIFFSFSEKLDAADDETTTTVQSILSLTKDSNQEDVTPAYGTKLDETTSTGEVAMSAINIVQTAAISNLTTDTGPEAVPHNEQTFLDALRFYTNKGALKACIGSTRHFRLTEHNPIKSFFINKFVPRAIRRIVPYTFFAILCHADIQSARGSLVYNPALTGTSGHVGINLNCNYDEWHIEHNQDAMTS